MRWLTNWQDGDQPQYFASLSPLCHYSAYDEKMAENAHLKY
jgi:hypothetical protein